jgi:hypothetical protein
MAGPEQVIRAAVTLPISLGLGIARRVVGVVDGLLSGDDERDTAPLPTDDVEVAVAADDAMTRERDPVEEAPLLPDDDLSGNIEPEVEVVAESADEGATEPPGPEVHADDAVRAAARTPPSRW